MNILIVINPISGDTSKASLLNTLRNQLTKKHTASIYKTSGKDDLEQLKKILQKSFDRILVMGGDGTIKLVAEAIGNKKIPIGILPAGSANGLASDLGLPTAPEKFIATALGNKTKQVDAVSINKQLSLHISDFGLNASLIKEYDESSFRGKLGYAFNAIPTLLQDKGPYEFSIKTNGQTLKRKAIMLAIANSKKFGTGAIVNPNGKIDDGYFELLIFKKLDVVEILKTLQEVPELSPDFVEIISVKKALITTNTPVDFQIDGEYRNPIQEIEVHILPNKLNLIVPDNNSKS